MAPAKGVLLAHTDFPLYTVRGLDERHFLVAGGGGQAKTGVANAIEVYELKSSKEGVKSECVCRHDTGLRAVMNCSSFYDNRNHHLATGEDELCHTYSVKYKVVSPTQTDKAENVENVRQRNAANSSGAEKTGQQNGVLKKQLTFQIEEGKSVATDFSDDGGFQKCVRFSPSCTHLVTGGADGYLRLWKYPELTKVWEVQAHKNEIDDIDFSPDGSKIISVSRDKNGAVWKFGDAKKITDLVWTYKTSDPYRFRACRYGLIEGQKDKFNIYTVNIPVTRSAKNPCYISLWDSSKFSTRKTASTGAEVISAFAVSDDGVFLGVGSISGSVSVFISFSLQRLYHVKEAHSIFVTSVEFLPSSDATRAVTGDQDFNLLSISADNTIRLHQCPERSTIHPGLVIAVLAIIIYFLFYMMAELGI